jgi:hypothetical protein
MMLDDFCQNMNNTLQISFLVPNPIIYKDPLGHTEPIYDILQELDWHFLCDVYYWHHFHPLGKCVDGDK